MERVRCLRQGRGTMEATGAIGAARICRVLESTCAAGSERPGPAFLSRLQLPGLVQIWTGLLCSTAPGWSVLVRPPSNMRGSFLYSAYEGIIETDSFRPCPLFMNIQLLATDVDIQLPKLVPLLQVQPLLRETYSENTHS